MKVYECSNDFTKKHKKIKIHKVKITKHIPLIFGVELSSFLSLEETI